LEKRRESEKARSAGGEGKKVIRGRRGQRGKKRTLGAR